MKLRRSFPLPGMALALVACAMILLAGVDAAICGGILVLWIATLWISRPEVVPVERRERGMQISRDTMSKLIQHSGLPMLLLDRNRILVANTAASEALGEHIAGQDARVPLRQPAAVELLDSPDGGTAAIPGLTGPRSIWQMSRFPIDERYWIVELVNRTAEADISRAHTDFVANASHELRTPLASIIGYVETLLDSGTDMDREEVEHFLRVVLKQANRLQLLVDDLMSLSRVEAEKHDRPNEPVDLAGLVTRAAHDAGSPDDRARIKVNPASGPLLILGDEQQLEQLVRNLVDNALKYGFSDTPVDVSLEPDEEHQRVILRVADRGEGIDAEHIPHLTRRFYRTDPGRSQASGGTGLGLAIVKHIVERHRGVLDIASVKGEGTIVTVRFPILAKEAGTLS